MIGANLKRLRRGRSQKQQAALLGISAQQLNDFENDRRSPRLSTLEKLARLYGVSLAELVDPEHAIPSTDQDAAE